MNRNHFDIIYFIRAPFFLVRLENKRFFFIFNLFGDWLKKKEKREKRIR